MSKSSRRIHLVAISFGRGNAASWLKLAERVRSASSAQHDRIRILTRRRQLPAEANSGVVGRGEAMRRLGRRRRAGPATPPRASRRRGERRGVARPHARSIGEKMPKKTCRRLNTQAHRAVWPAPAALLRQPSRRRQPTEVLEHIRGGLDIALCWRTRLSEAPVGATSAARPSVAEATDRAELDRIETALSAPSLSYASARAGRECLVDLSCQGATGSNLVVSVSPPVPAESQNPLATLESIHTVSMCVGGKARIVSYLPRCCTLGLQRSAP